MSSIAGKFSIQQGFTHPFLLQSLLRRPDQDNQLPNAGYNSVSPVTSLVTANHAVFVSPGTELVDTELVRQDDELALGIEPHSDTDVVDNAFGIDTTAQSCTLCSNLTSNVPRHFASAFRPSQSSESFGPNTWQDDAHMANVGTCNGSSRQEHFVFSASPQSVRHRVNKMQEMEGFALPDSLARSLDSSEMDKIAKAIVRVNEYGSSTVPLKPGAASQSRAFKHTTPRVLPSVGAFTVQCANCFKWRLIPSKEQYEQIRQNILEKPFFCTSWQPGASCSDPPELGEDSKLLWAIDKPNIPLAPNGWQRLLVIRGEGCSKFGDIYYVAPSGKRLRSMPEIDRYLSEHPDLFNGVSLSQFSFSTPKALDETYCRKRTAGSSTVMRGSVTHKMVQTNNIGVLGGRQPGGEQPTLNAPLAVEPLRAWDPNHHALMLCHRSGELEGSASV